MIPHVCRQPKCKMVFAAANHDRYNIVTKVGLVVKYKCQYGLPSIAIDVNIFRHLRERYKGKNYSYCLPPTAIEDDDIVNYCWSPVRLYYNYTRLEALVCSTKSDRYYRYY